MTTVVCFWNATIGACAKEHWASCGYTWLNVAPVGLFATLWLCYGVRLLQRHGFLARFLQLNASTIHDQVAQGIAIALSQRKFGSDQQLQLQRYVKLCAMCSEWPTYTFAPLSIAFKVSGTPPIVDSLLFSLNFTHESWNLGMAVGMGVLLLLLRQVHAASRYHAPILMRFVYPMTFDLLYIPIMSTFLRLGTCVTGYEHLALPGGATCDCLDRFGIFWAVGFVGFFVTYRSALLYKMHIEPLGETMDFRFQPGFQLLMVMARTLYPMITIFVNNQDTTRAGGIGLTTFLLAVSTFLLLYSHKTQPCIGSGRIPNNLRVLTFSSAIYTAFCVLVVLALEAPIQSLYYALLPLPMVWVGAWKVNDRRALLYHIPGVRIPDLLRHPSPDVSLVGAIAALHLNPNNVHERDLGPILEQLDGLAASVTATPLCRAYALRTLWFSHIENFIKADVLTIGDDAPIGHDLWLKDRANIERRSSRHDRKTHQSKKRVKISTVTTTSAGPTTDLLPATASAPSHGTTSKHTTTLTTKSQRFRPRHTMAPRAIVPLGRPSRFHVIMIGFTSWISHKESSADAVAAHRRIANLAFDVLAQSSSVHDVAAMHTIGVFLLEWYRSGYLRMNRARYLQLLTTLSATNDPKLVLDATHTLYCLTLDGGFALETWVARPLALSGLLHALSHASRRSVHQAATIAARVAAFAAARGSNNLSLLLTLRAAASLYTAFQRWAAAYDVSVLLEAVYLSLHQIASRQHLSYPGVPSKSTRLLLAVKRAKARFKHNIGKVEPVPASTRLSSMKMRLSMLMQMRNPKRAPGPMAKTLTFRQLVNTVRGKAKATPMYVPLDVVPEIERRQAIRRQFVLKLELAFAMVMTTHASGNDRRRSCIATKRPELDNAVTNALKLMQLADECALEEYVATTLDPTMRAFLHPYLDQFQDDAPSVPRWRRWPF